MAKSKILKIEKQVVEFTKVQAPGPRKIIKTGIKQLALGLGDVKPLEGKLLGFHRLRIHRFRIIFCYDTNNVYCLFIEHRSLVYSLFEELLLNQDIKQQKE
jgi:mRNA-degrading endonuclease RelE of RelBE toxin-antitoxin system